MKHLKRLELSNDLMVLDVGCGNGRFALHLKEFYAKPFHYLGVDISAPALERARDQLTDMGSVTLRQHDLIAAAQLLPPEAQRSFSLIVAFGLLHHVPGRHQRRALLAELAERLEYQGILAISIWQFGRFERFQKKIIPWDAFQARTGIEVDPSQLEPGDYILSWGSEPPAYRYCHFVDSEEAAQLTSSLPLECFDTFSSDGATNNLNHYYLMRKA
jgi:SAM-dependent methyltransferase